jgi:hypothetical protein
MVRGSRYVLLFILLLAGLILAPLRSGSWADGSKPIAKTKRAEAPRFKAVPTQKDDGFILREAGGQVACLDSTADELETFRKRNPNLRLRQISHHGDEIRAQETGLRIVLRSTAQLDGNPAAKQAFIAAAAAWEAVIQNPITIIVDVDFGPTRFGTPYPSGVLGATLSQRIPLSGDDNYVDVRSRLVNRASSTEEADLYNALPSGVVPTDMGSTEGVLAPSSVFRALGAISATADPPSEPSLGDPPSIGFNSAFNFDFDPSNGIDSNATDFDAVAVHELGHVLGFSSMVGSKELNPTEPVFVTMLDLFRLAPGATVGSFASASRLLASGGTHNFFTGTTELALSTGRPRDPVGGDGRQASHWKDDILSGSFIGIMDPTIAQGEREQITSNDLKALDLLGYALMGSAPPPPDDAVALTSGVAQSGSISAPPPDGAVLGGTQYSIAVPAGATQLRVELSGNQDVDLYVRFGAKIVLDEGLPVADFFSESFTGNETITITRGTDPALQQGTYFIAIGNFGPGVASFSVTATTSSDGGGSNTPPSISSLSANLVGDVLTLSGTVTDPDGDIGQARSNLLSGSDQVIASSGHFPVNFGTATSVDFTLELDGISQFPSALKATLEFVDNFGNRSSVVAADFSQADSGGPTLKKVTYNGSKMIIKGKRLDGSHAIEINGTVVSMNFGTNKKKLKLNGNASELNVRQGDNRIGVRVNSLRSNLVVFTH